MNWNTRTADDPHTPAILKHLLKRGYLTGDEHPAVIVHNLARFKERLAYLRDSFAPGALHTLAVKANPLPALLRIAVEGGFGLEAASLGELALAESVGCPAERTVFDSPAKTRAELARAAAAGYVVNANSGSELRRVRELKPANFPLGLRVNPVVAEAARESSTMVATARSKFGVTMEQAERLLGEFPEVTGLHVHVGSQVATRDDLVEAARRVVRLAAGWPQIDWLDIGGGLPTRYHRDDPGLDPKEYYRALLEAAPELAGYRLLTEMGRAIQTNCGFAVSRVEYVNEDRAVLHFGADLALRECYQNGAWYHEFEVFDATGAKKEGARTPYDLYGPLCFSGDRLAEERSLPPLEEGDLVVMHDIGGYTLGMWSRYCSRAIPEIVGWNGAALGVLRARETADQIVRSWTGETAGFQLSQ